MNIGFKEARQKAGLSARRASIALDVSTQVIFGWESGKFMPEAKRLPEIAKLYGCSVDELLKKEGETYE